MGVWAEALRRSRLVRSFPSHPQGTNPDRISAPRHITSTVGSVGKLMRLESMPMQHAISIAATQVTGLREMFGTDIKFFHVGRAARNGRMAAPGYTGSLQAPEAKRGWARIMSVENNIDTQFTTLRAE
ncbi:hypothetical protein K438DRAFT_1805852 [Mycena galopus ATCC 62051]|nr:hypothetical protein K438DRAFT_1805852 [Mycena galopus ATCC 62051]